MNGFININVIMDRVTRHPLIKDIPFETVVDLAVDFMRIVGTPPSFIEKTEYIEIENYRGQLPCDFYEMIQVRLAKSCDKGFESYDRHPVFRYTTDSFHMSEHKPKVSDLTYKIQGGCIFTAPLRDGTIEIAYMAMPTDDEGYPLLPDNSAYTRALQAYIKKEWFTIQFDQDKIDQKVMAKADQDYAWAVGQAQTDLIRPNMDQMQAISNMWNTLVDRGQEHRKGFVHGGSKEHIIIH